MIKEYTVTNLSISKEGAWLTAKDGCCGGSITVRVDMFDDFPSLGDAVEVKESIIHGRLIRVAKIDDTWVQA